MQKIEKTLSSVEVAEMVNKEHKMMLRDLRRYTTQFNQCKIAPVDFFTESTYKDAKGETRPCYRITKKGCEFIAHKLTGTKGTIFTARYINRFHEMQDIISQEAGLELPWFIRKFEGKYIMLFRDFETITGISLHNEKPFWKKYYAIMNGRCPLYYNCWSSRSRYETEEQKAEFRNKYGFDYGEDDFMGYLYPCGIRKVLELCMRDVQFYIAPKTYVMIMEGLNAIQPPKKEITVRKPAPAVDVMPIKGPNNYPQVQITIITSDEMRNSI